MGGGGRRCKGPKQIVNKNATHQRMQEHQASANRGSDPRLIGEASTHGLIEHQIEFIKIP